MATNEIPTLVGTFREEKQGEYPIGHFYDLPGIDAVTAVSEVAIRVEDQIRALAAEQYAKGKPRLRVQVTTFVTVSAYDPEQPNS